MTSLGILPDPDLGDEPAGAGLLSCDRGNLPLLAMTVVADITGLMAATTIRQTFANPHDCPIEATYIFPLPDRAAVTGLSVTVGDRRITGRLQERQAARDAYDGALLAGQRAALVEQDRPDVFTTRIGNLAPGEEATVELALAGTVPCELEEATFRINLVVAPRYIPGTPLDGASAGQGTALDTDAVPDASRITPPVLLPGSPNPVRLAVTVRLDPAGMAVSDLRSSLHAVIVAGQWPGPVTVELQPGERLNRDFILRYRTVSHGATRVTALAIPDHDRAATEGGTYVVTVLPPATSGSARARDVVVVLDRSGSMGGWKMVAARRAAARIVDSLTRADRFAILAFDHAVERPTSLPGDTLVEASDRNRYRAVEWLGQLEARGGTEMAAALQAAHTITAPGGGVDRARSCILVTDGQVGNEDQLVGLATDSGVRMFTVGIDQSVNAGLLQRLAAATGGRCDLVESEDRLDAVLVDLQRRIGPPLLESVTVRFEGLEAEDGTVTPSRAADLYAGVPLVVSGRFRGRPRGRAIVSGHHGATMSCEVVATANPAAAAVWARAHLHDLEDRYAALPGTAVGQRDALGDTLVAVSLRHRVLCRFTAWVAIDQSGELVEGRRHRMVQPVEIPAGWAAAGAPGNWMAAPMAAPRPGYSGGAPDVVAPPPVPYQPQPAPGSRPPIRMATPNGSANSPRRRGPRRESETTGAAGISLLPYHQRLEQLLAQVDLVGDRAADQQARLAADARRLATDMASVVDRSPLIDLLQALAAALTAGQPGAIQTAAHKLRKALAHEGRGRPARSKPFWR